MGNVMIELFVLIGFDFVSRARPERGGIINTFAVLAVDEINCHRNVIRIGGDDMFNPVRLKEFFGIVFDCERHGGTTAWSLTFA